MTSILGIVRAGLREGGAHPVREGDIDPNTGLGPLDERGFVPSFVIGSALDLDHAVDPNTGLDPHLNIDPNRINMLVGSNDDPDRPTDPNTGLDRPPVHSSPRDRSEFTFVMTSSVMAGSPAKAGDSADDVGEDSEKGLTAITPGDLKNG